MNQATARPRPDRSGGSLDRLLPPTPRQRNAINVLNPLRTSFNDRKILDWLELTRSFWKTFEQQTDFDPPTEREVVALVTLASHDNDNIREWLRQSRGAGKYFRLIYSNIVLILSRLLNCLTILDKHSCLKSAELSPFVAQICQILIQFDHLYIVSLFFRCKALSKISGCSPPRSCHRGRCFAERNVYTIPHDPLRYP